MPVDHLTGTTHDLRLGDVVHTHGMDVELDRKPIVVHDLTHDRTCYSYRGRVLNIDDVEPWLAGFVRGDWRDTDRGDIRWTVQGNELRTWTFTRYGASGYRLTDGDETAAVARIADVVAGWTSHLTPAPGGVDAVLSLVRIGAHAIGCSTFDLRHCELEWLTQQAHELLAAVPAR